MDVVMAPLMSLPMPISQIESPARVVRACARVFMTSAGYMIHCAEARATAPASISRLKLNGAGIRDLGHSEKLSDECVLLSLAFARDVNTKSIARSIFKEM